MALPIRPSLCAARVTAETKRGRPWGLDVRRTRDYNLRVVADNGALLFVALTEETSFGVDVALPAVELLDWLLLDDPVAARLTAEAAVTVASMVTIRGRGLYVSTTCPSRYGEFSSRQATAEYSAQGTTRA